MQKKWEHFFVEKETKIVDFSFELFSKEKNLPLTKIASNETVLKINCSASESIWLKFYALLMSFERLLLHRGSL